MKNEQTIYGLHAVRAMLARHPERVTLVRITERREDPRVRVIEDLAREHSRPVQRMDAQALKRLLGDRSTERLMVFQRAYRLVALITPILERMRLALERSIGQPVTRAHLGRPVNFEGRGARRNELAVSRLSEAAENAGFRQMSCGFGFTCLLFPAGCGAGEFAWDVNELLNSSANFLEIALNPRAAVT